MIDPVTELLRAAQRPPNRYLWVPSDAITFTPSVCSEVFGDGRALFAFGTINSRPAYWIVRGDSKWTCGYDYGADASDGSPDIGEFSDDILEALEDEFGSAECGYDFDYNASGRPIHCETKRFLPESSIRYPHVNYGGGCHWGRLDWPDLAGVNLVPHPLHPRVRILAEPSF